MADSMCGPSNPLQNFQKQSTTDRTLHQDRLVSRPSPSQGFRSSPGPSGQYLDPEFEAFQAGQLPLDHGFQHQQYPPQPAFTQQPQPGPSAWASDFQHLSISSPPPQFQQQPYIPQQAQQRHDTGGWHQDFARQQGGMGMTGQGMGQQMNGQTNSPYRYSPMSGMGMAPQYSGGYAGQQAEMPIAQQKQPAEAFDEEAFARAFEEAAQAEMASKEESRQEVPQQEVNREQSQGVEMGQDIMINESAERLMAASDGRLKQEPLGADTIEDPKYQDPAVLQETHSPDALARTAGELLESVRHNRSAKFQNSQFFDLMRQFRDKEVQVVGDRIVGVGKFTANANANGAEGLTAEGMAGVSEGEEAIKDITITSLLEKLREVALDPEKPFIRTPQSTRTVLHALITLHAHLPSIIPSKISSTLRALSTHPILSQIPSIQEIVSAIQLMRRRMRGSSALWWGRRRVAKVCRRADDGVIFASSTEEEEDIVATWQRERFAAGDEVRDANFDAAVTRIRARVAELTGHVPATTPTMATTTMPKSKGDAEAEAMWNVLGYSITETGNQELDRELLELHSRRMEDILGTTVVKVKQLCEEKGIWGPDLGIAEFRVLMMNFEDEGMHDWTRVPWYAVAEGVRSRIEEKVTEGKEDSGMLLEIAELARQLQKNGVRFNWPTGMNTDEMLRRTRVKMELFKEGGLRSMEEKTAPNPGAAERFRARRAAKEALSSPEEMRDMAEESVGRVKVRED